MEILVVAGFHLSGEVTSISQSLEETETFKVSLAFDRYVNNVKTLIFKI